MYEKFSKLLQEKDLTAYRVSKDTGVSQQTLSDWKKGKSQPKTDKLRKIAKYFDVPVEYFTDEEENLDIKKLTPIDDDRREFYENLKKLSSDDLGRVEGYVKGLLAKYRSDK